jgi:hypothetical protein
MPSTISSLPSSVEAVKSIFRGDCCPDMVFGSRKNSTECGLYLNVLNISKIGWINAENRGIRIFGLCLTLRSKKRGDC